MSKVFIRHGNFSKSINKEELFKFLAKRVLDKKYEFGFYNDELKSFYKNVYDFILKNLNETFCIQIYQDNVIRLHLKHGHFDNPKSIFLEDKWICNDESTIGMLKELITFSKYN